MEINVLMTTDKNYISQARVVIWSARKHTKIETKLIITILCSQDLDQVSKNRLLILENELENLVIKFHEVDEGDFSGLHSEAHISIAAYYRLIAAKVLDVEKCIYLDSDLIVSLDLNDLYTIDISDVYVGGVVDMGLISKPNSAFQYMKNCNIEDFSDYINTGVLLMNLDLMRKEHLVEKFFSDMVQGNNPWLDQDVINRVCHGKIFLLDWSFNHMVGHSDDEYMWICGETKRAGRGEIYHWAGANKVWHNLAFWQAKIWWEIAKEALEPDIYQEYYYIAFKHMRQILFSEIAEKCKDRDEIVIVGFSDHGRDVMSYLRRYGISGKIIFCDNNDLKSRMHIKGSAFLSVEEAVSRCKNAIWINAVQNGRDEVNNQIMDLGISENQILEYYAMNRDYYSCLDTKYKKSVFKENMYLQE